jgi:hypothetical protein
LKLQHLITVTHHLAAVSTLHQYIASTSNFLNITLPPQVHYPSKKISQKSPHCVAGLSVSRCSCAVVFLNVCVGLAVDHTGVASATLLWLVWQGGGEGAKRCK